MKWLRLQAKCSGGLEAPLANETARGMGGGPRMEHLGALTCRAALPDRVRGHHLALRRAAAR